MRRLAPRLLVLTVGLTVLLSGCLGSDDGSPQPKPAPAQSLPPPSLPSSSASPTPSSAPNTPPTATLNVSLANGTAPLSVAFEITGDDADGDALSWRLDANGDGTADAEGDTLPATFTFTFDTPGNYTARATLDDGDDTTTAQRSVNVTAPPPPGPPAPITFTGNITGLYVLFVDYFGEPNEHTFDLAAPVANITVTLVGHETAPDLDFILYAPDGTVAGSRQNENEPTGAVWPVQEPPLSITDPKLLAQTGTWKIEVLAGIAVSGGYDLHVTFS